MTVVLRAVVLVLLACYAVPPAAAAGRAQQDNPSPSDAVVEQRLRFIEKRLDDSKFHGQAWYWGWLTVNLGSAVGNGLRSGLAGESDDRVRMGSQAALGAIGAADLLIRPLRARLGAGPIRDLPEGTPEEKRRKLRAAESLLRRNAERAQERKSWVVHLASAVLNGAAGAATALAGDQMGGVITAATGFVGGEIRILTQPWEPEGDWEAYQRLKANSAATSFGVAMVPDGLGVVVRVQW